MLTDIAPVTIGIEPTFSSDSTFSVAISGEFITTLSKSYNLVVSILEDSIVAPQKFYSGVQGRTTDVTEYNYVHRHVLRGNLNGIWGTPFAGGEFGNTYNINIPKYTIDATWEKKNLSLVAYVYDTDTKEILHVSETHLMH